MSSRTGKQLEEQIAEIIDRYGKPPTELFNVFSIMRPGWPIEPRG